MPPVSAQDSATPTRMTMPRGPWRALLLAAMIWSTGCQPEPLPAVAERVTLRSIRPVELAAGETANAVVEVIVSEGFHVQANPVPLDYLVPTRLEVEAVEGWEISPTIYPRGKPYHLQGSPDVLSVYDGIFEITLPLHASADQRPGSYTFRGYIHYQCCDHRMCFRPTSEPVVFSVLVLGTEK